MPFNILVHLDRCAASARHMLRAAGFIVPGFVLHHPGNPDRPAIAIATPWNSDAERLKMTEAVRLAVVAHNASAVTLLGLCWTGEADDAADAFEAAIVGCTWRGSDGVPLARVRLLEIARDSEGDPVMVHARGDFDPAEADPMFTLLPTVPPSADYQAKARAALAATLAEAGLNARPLPKWAPPRHNRVAPDGSLLH